MYKDNGFSKVQNCIEIGQIVLANTAPEGHKSINESLISLQEHWSSLASKMVETKVNLYSEIIVHLFKQLFVSFNHRQILMNQFKDGQDF